ncbi:hypothetical protein ESCO_004486 [Escovopsis weberi]|uniref:Uncharacterized protein n=1 Tax=Escovopsis weberi TaxID=150374 RepID=A0A0M8N5Q1_ESCWE|nr:hypothetical protein ESCO_004486 [Escovopsis weberi]
MPPVQKTFSIVPDGAGIAAAAGVVETTRPMTSKQARKAYKQKTKAPARSREEWLRWERAEQERIRKELDKERVAVKARAARERKKEKESREREEKRRNGLPLVSVRPSQDTIARGAGTEEVLLACGRGP